MEPVRILQVVPNMNLGGLETFLMNVYRSLDRDRIQFDFLVHYQKRCHYDDEIEALGGMIHRLTVREDHNLLKYLRELDSFFKHHPEYRIVHGHMESLGSFYFSAAKRYGVTTTVCHSHSTSTDRTMKGCLKRLLSKSAKRHADFRFACSAEAGKYLFGNRAFMVIPNAIDTVRFVFDSVTRDIVRKKFCLDGKLVVGHVGRFEPVKNHRFLLRIFTELIQMRPDAALVLIGDGILLPQIKETASDWGVSDKVLFTGVRSDVCDLYQAMDVFLLPSVYEGLPLAVIEAQCAGLPVLLSDVVSKEARIADEFYPISLNKSPAYWAEQILAVAGRRGRTEAGGITDSRFDIKTVSDELTTFYLDRYGQAGKPVWQFTL